MIRLVSFATLAVAIAGCGLIDTDITNFDLSMPEKEFTVDTSQWQLSSDPTFPEIPCADTPTVCSAGISEVCGNDALCFGSCDGDNCTAKVLIALYQSVNLYDEKPELQTINDQPLVSVTIDRVGYDVTENTLNIASPPITVYVAPQNVMAPGDPQALAVGTVSPIAPGTTSTGNDVDMTPEGRENLRSFMREYRTEFNILVGAEVDIMAFDPIPSGRLRAVVTVDAHAGL
jgi:hypothetical protein